MSGCYRARCTTVIEITNEGSVNKRTVDITVDRGGVGATINMSSKERHFGTPAISEACGKREPALECSGVETIRRKCL